MRSPLGRSLPALSASAFILLWAAPVSGQPQISTTPILEIFLQAWYPEIGPPPIAAHSRQQAVLDIARFTRQGNLAAAEEKLRQVTSGLPLDHSTRALALLFEREVVQQRYRLVGSTKLSGGETSLHWAEEQDRIGALGQALVQAAAFLAPAERAEAESAHRLMDILTLCSVAHPSSLRNTRWYGSIPIPGLPPPPPPDCPALLQTFLQGLPLSGKPQGKLLDLWLKVRIAQASGDMDQARQLSERGYETAVAAGFLESARLWLLQRGDLEAAPEGSVLALGDDLALRSVFSFGPEQRIEPACQEAEAWYRKARESSAPAPEADLAIRSAYLAYCRRDPSSVDGFRTAAELARKAGSVTLEAMALGAEAMLRGDPEPFTRAVALASTARHPGLLLSLARLTHLYCARQAALGEPLGAARRLAFSIHTLSAQEQERAAADQEELLASLCGALGFEDAQILWLERAARVYRSSLEKAEKANREQKIKQPPPFDDMANARGEKGALSAVLSSLFLSLKKKSLSLDRSDEGWTRRLNDVGEELKQLGEGSGLLDPSFAPWASRMMRRIELQARLVHETQRLQDCEGILREYPGYREELLATGDRLMLLQLDLGAAHCDPAHRARLLDELEAIQPVAAVRQALGRLRASQGPLAPKLPELQSQALRLELSDALLELQTFLHMAFSLKAADLMHRWLDQAEPMMREEPLLQGQVPSLELSRATAFLLQKTPEKARQARSLLERLLALPALRSPQSLGSRIAIRQMEIDAAALLGEAEEALTAFERLREDLAWRTQLRTGLRPDSAESSELAMLLRASTRGEASAEQAQQLGLFFLRATLFNETAQPPNREQVEQALSSLPAGSTLLAYHVSPLGILLWRHEKGAPLQMLRLQPELMGLQQKTRRFQEALVNQEEWQELSSQLYTALIEPAGPLPPGNLLVLTGTDAFGGFPFEALGRNTGRLLIHDHPVVYVNRLVQGNGELPSVAPKGPAVVVGLDVTSRDRREAEAADVARLFGVSPLVGTDATVERMVASLPAAAWIHIATDGEVNEVNPYLSYLLLAGGQRLKAWQLFGRARQAELFVLSACDTQRVSTSVASALSPEGGKITLADFALSGGTRRVLASLWKADETSTSTLMHEIYSAWRQEGLDLASALQRARLALLEQGVSHPYFFANFILSARDLRFVHLAGNRSGADQVPIGIPFATFLMHEEQRADRKNPLGHRGGVHPRLEPWPRAPDGQPRDGLHPQRGGPGCPCRDHGVLRRPRAGRSLSRHRPGAAHAAHPVQ